MHTSRETSKRDEQKAGGRKWSSALSLLSSSQNGFVHYSELHSNYDDSGQLRVRAYTE